MVLCFDSGDKMIDRSLNYGRHVIRRFLKEIAPYEHVLDIGAGAGVDLGIAREICLAAKLSAVEVFPQSVALLRENSVDVYSLNIERGLLPFSEGVVDVVIANQILEHTKEVFWIFHEVSRILPMHGHFIVGVPNLAALHNRILLALGRQPSSIKTCSAHVRGFTRDDLLRFVEVCFPGGYQLVGFGGSNFYPFPPVLAVPLAQAFPTMSWGIFLLLKKIRDYSGEFLDYPDKESLETNFYRGEE